MKEYKITTYPQLTDMQYANLIVEHLNGKNPNKVFYGEFEGSFDAGIAGILSDDYARVFQKRRFWFDRKVARINHRILSGGPFGDSQGVTFINYDDSLLEEGELSDILNEAHQRESSRLKDELKDPPDFLFL